MTREEFLRRAEQLDGAIIRALEEQEQLERTLLSQTREQLREAEKRIEELCQRLYGKGEEQCAQ